MFGNIKNADKNILFTDFMHQFYGATGGRTDVSYIECQTPSKIQVVTFASGNRPNFYVTATIFGSNDNVNYNQLGVCTATSGTSGGQANFEYKDSKYKFYKISVYSYGPEQFAGTCIAIAIRDNTQLFNKYWSGNLSETVTIDYKKKTGLVLYANGKGWESGGLNYKVYGSNDGVNFTNCLLTASGGGTMGSGYSKEILLTKYRYYKVDYENVGGRYPQASFVFFNLF
ncbi:hypothetical protein [Anaerorhabdus sp.]|uniref:hypothetical protein n=1 Tax=Anaerorhabdus sp. TaxID=1872524 RepID=UPI002FC9ECD8